MLAISAGFGCALFTVWLTANQGSPYRKDQIYIGFSNSGGVYWLEYKGTYRWSGKDIWLYEKVTGKDMRDYLGARKGELPDDIVLIKTKAELRLEQTLDTTSILDSSRDFRDRVRKAVNQD